MRKRKNGLCFLSAVFLVILQTGCIQISPSMLVRDSQVTAMFSSSKVLSGHNYYYVGRKFDPIAIIALDKKYQLVSRLWMPINNPEQELADLIFETKQLRSRSPSCRFDGAIIYTPNQEKAGYWYAKWHLTSVRTPELGKIEIFPPAEPTFGPCKPEIMKVNN